MTAKDIFCPVCGYYCLGKGGHGCIHKPSLVAEEDDQVWGDRAPDFASPVRYWMLHYDRQEIQFLKDKLRRDMIMFDGVPPKNVDEVKVIQELTELFKGRTPHNFDIPGYRPL